MKITLMTFQRQSSRKYLIIPNQPLLLQPWLPISTVVTPWLGGACGHAARVHIHPYAMDRPKGRENPKQRGERLSSLPHMILSKGPFCRASREAFPCAGTDQAGGTKVLGTDTTASGTFITHVGTRRAPHNSSSDSKATHSWQLSQGYGISREEPPLRSPCL